MSFNLSSLQTPEDYRAAREHVFPSAGSFKWFQRRHKAELVSRGAQLLIAGQWHVHPEKFDEAVLAIGAALAERRMEAA